MFWKSIEARRRLWRVKDNNMEKEITAIFIDKFPEMEDILVEDNRDSGWLHW